MTTLEVPVTRATQTFTPTTSRRGWLQGLAADSLYVLTGFPVALAAFVLVLTGFVVGVGLLVLTIGLPVLVLTFALARGFAEAERARLALLAGEPVHRPAYRPTKPGFSGMVSLLADPRRWLDVIHAIAAFPVATATWAVAVGWFAGAFGGVTYGLWEWALPADDEGLAELLGWDGRAADIATNTALGVVALLTLPVVIRVAAGVQAGVSRAMLTAEA